MWYAITSVDADRGFDNANTVHRFTDIGLRHRVGCNSPLAAEGDHAFRWPTLLEWQIVLCALSRKTTVPPPTVLTISASMTREVLGALWTTPGKLVLDMASQV